MAELWAGFMQLIFSALQFFYAGVGDYGLAIVVLTVAMRIVLTPLTLKQTKSMYELQQVQPKIKALQEKHKNNKEKQQEELMKFYKENKVNPFGGCLPLLLQMPIFIGLYNVLGGTAERPGLLLAYLSKHADISKAFWLILPDITKTPGGVYAQFSASGVMTGIVHALPYVIFVLLFGVSTWLPQYLMTKDPIQRRTGTYMAVFMLYIGWISPAGVLLYWVTSSGWQVAQQIITQRMLAKPEGA